MYDSTGECSTVLSIPSPRVRHLPTYSQLSATTSPSTPTDSTQMKLTYGVQNLSRQANIKNRKDSAL